MTKIKKFIKKHPAWSIFILIVFIIGGLYINKFMHPHMSFDELYYDKVKYEYLDDLKWEVLETPDCKLGKFYNYKFSIIPWGSLYSFADDPEKTFIKDRGPFSNFSYVREDKKPNVYDSSQIEFIELELGDLDRSTFEIKKEEDIIKFVSFVESVEKKQVEKSKMAGTYNNSMNLNLKIKNHPVIYKVGMIFEEETTGEWVISIGFTPSYDMNYPLPENLGAIIHSTIEKASE